MLRMSEMECSGKPANALYIVQGEINCIVTEMKRTLRHSSHAIRHIDNPLIRNFTELRETLHKSTEIADLEPSTFLAPFLEVVRSEETSGRITGLALTSLNKFIAYGLIDCRKHTGAAAVDSIADAVTHARFECRDPESDEVVLMRILNVLRTLLLSPSGANLTNESVCEIMQSGFRICFESRLSKLLRRTADHILVEMVQLLFTRLPQFTEDSRWAKNMRKLKMRAAGMHKPRRKDNSVSQSSDSSKGSTADAGAASSQLADEQSEGPQAMAEMAAPATDTDATDNRAAVSLTLSDSVNSVAAAENVDPDNQESSLASPQMVDIHEGLPEVRQDSQADLHAADADSSSVSTLGDEEEAMDFINPKGVRFIPKKEGAIVVPYGLPAIRELFRFLISIMNPSDKQNNDEMSHMGIYLLTIALETAVDYLPKYASLMTLVRDELCFNLFRQLQTDKVSVFAAAMRACFLLFESLRGHLKFQLEMYLTKLMELIVSDNVRVTYDIKEIALQGLVQLWRIPGLVTELYLNYDCDVHCTNLFEDITKLLSKNAFPVTGLFSTHVLSLDALLTVLESVEAHCHSRIMAAKKDEETVRKSSPVAGQSRNSLPKCGRLVDQSSESIPPLETLHARKQQKQVYHQAVEQFNQKPKLGIAYLQEQGYLDQCNKSIVTFLKETPRLNKALIGEYISRKDNPELTDTYMRSFDFAGKRLDEALRMLLETFRLPGESPVIEFLMEHFSTYWFEANNAPFTNTDAAFTLVYAIIMLNVDQHSQTAKKQNIPMTLQQFRKNVKGVDGGKDFDQGMLEEIFNAIHKEEIVLPEERTGLVKETYSWKVLLDKASGPGNSFVHAPSGCYDNELFTIIWGPTIAALSFVFDKSQEQAIVHKAITGFRKCAMISAHYGLSEVFDNLVISLCKFTTFLNSAETSDQIPISFAGNLKAQLAAKTVFSLAHRHGDMLREGWKNILDCMMTLYRAQLLPGTFTEAEDFLHVDGKIKLVKEDKAVDPRNEPGGLWPFLNIFGAENASQKGQSAEEVQARETSKKVIDECDLEFVIEDTKFLRTSSLQELIKALISLCQISELDGEGSQDEETVVFFLELLIRVVLQNRDRAGSIWQNVRDHISSIIMRATDHTFLTERAVTGLLRMAIRLLCREEVANQVLPSLRVLLLMKPTVLRSMSRQLAFGLHQLLETNAANIHSTQDWYCLFTLLEVVGAGGGIPANPFIDSNLTNDLDPGALSDGEVGGSTEVDVDRGYTSDSEVYNNKTTSLASRPSNGDISSDQPWIMVNKKPPRNASLEVLPQVKASSKVQHNQFSIVLDEELYPHDTLALMKCSEVLTLLVRDAAHVTPFNFDSCVHALRMFVEASMNNATVATKKPIPSKNKGKRGKSHKGQPVSKPSHSPNSRMQNSAGDAGGEEDPDLISTQYHRLSEQLLELMHTLHTRASSIFHSWADEQQSEHENDGDICDAKTSSLWRRCWCPLLQGIARLCTDIRTPIRGQALTFLQRALLVQDLNQLSNIEWEACFNKVLFPLLSDLLDNSTISDSPGIEETRFRASTLLSKVYLTHLQALLSLSTFKALWLTILDCMDKYMHSDQSDQLTEGIPELLKNMLLVMGGMNIFYEESATTVKTEVCELTCDKLNIFLPALKRELFPDELNVPVAPPSPTTMNVPQPTQPPAAIAPTKQQEVPSQVGTDRSTSPSVSEKTDSRPVSPCQPPVHRTSSPVLVHPRPASPAGISNIPPPSFPIHIHPPLDLPPPPVIKLLPVDAPSFNAAVPQLYSNNASLPLSAGVLPQATANPQMNPE